MLKNPILKFLSFLFLGVLVFAKEQKIGFVESTRIFNEYQATQSANAQFNEFVSTCRDSVAKLQTNIASLKQELDAQKLLLSEEARLKKLDEIETLTETYNRYLQETFGPGGKVEQKNDELMAPLLKKVNEAIEKIATQEGFSMVIDLSDGIFYANPELNITELVINELNREYGAIALPQEGTKDYIGIFPLYDENSEAFSAQLGERCQNILYDALGAYSRIFQIVSINSIKTEYDNRGWNTQTKLEDLQIYQLARKLFCDYIVLGRVSKTSTKIEYTIYLKDINNEREVASKSNSVSEDIKLQEALTNDLRALLDAVQKK